MYQLSKVPCMHDEMNVNKSFANKTTKLSEAIMCFEVYTSGLRPHYNRTLHIHFPHKEKVI